MFGPAWSPGRFIGGPCKAREYLTLKPNRRTLGAVQFPKQCAAELEKLQPGAVPENLRQLLAKRRGREYYEGLLAGYAHAPQVAQLIELVASSAGRERWRPLELRYHDRCVVIDGRMRQLAPANFAFYAVMVRRRLGVCAADRRNFVAWDTEGLAHEYLCEYRRLAHFLDGNRERVEARLDRYGVERQWFEERKCRVNRAVRPLGEWTGRDYGIVSRGRRPNTCSGVIVDPCCIRISLPAVHAR